MERTAKEDIVRIAGLPILQLGDTNSLLEFEKALSIYGLREFGNLGHLIELDKYWEPDPISPPSVEEYSDRNDPLGLKKADLMETVKARRRHIEEMKSKHSSFFAVLYGQLSSESEEKVKQ